MQKKEPLMEHRMMDARFYQAQGMTQKEIADALGVTDRTVRNYLSERPRPRIKATRQSKLDPFREYVRKTIELNVGMNGELIYDSVRNMGYAGKRSVLKEYITKVRRETERQAVIRFETEPGFQAQVDWVEFGKQMVDGKLRKLYAFTMVLGYSRFPFVRFTTDMTSATLLACHEDAFRYFGGVPAEILYDNMKTAWIHDGEKWRPNKRLAAFACHYGFVPKRCQVRRPETKGKVERFNQYLEDNFFAGLALNSYSLDELNESVIAWIERIKKNKISGLGETREVRFDHEKRFLKPVVATPFDVRDSITLIVNRESCITWKTNRYSVSPSLIGLEVTLRPSVFVNTADIFAEGKLVRSITLEAEGAQRRVIDPVDREEIRRRWEKDRDRQVKLRFPKHRVREQKTVDVIVRSPSVYDRYIPGGAL